MLGGVENQHAHSVAAFLQVNADRGQGGAW